MTAVLLIDDHAMFREALLLSLSQALPGVTVHPASNGAGRSRSCRRSRRSAA